MDSERAKRNLLDDSDSEQEGGAPIASAFSVNQEYARRFEHNKKREEKHRLEEKFKKTGKAPAAEEEEDDDESSSDESEDEEGFLATEDLDAQISATLQAIRNKDPKVYDKEVTFYKETDDATTADKEKKEKPVYLKDYHREKLLAGDVGASDDEDETPKTYNQEQNALKKSIVSEINAAAVGDDSDEDDGFLKKKPSARVDSNGVHPSRKAALTITDVDVANADKNPETFLSNFMSARGWVPPDGSNWKAFESDDDDDNNNGQADEFEQAYNLRFEDPEKSNEFLRSYARDVAAKRSVRREEKSGRKRQRELEREQKEAAKEERREEKARLRKLKLEEAEAKLRKIKQAAGSVGKELTDEDWIKFLDDKWDDDKWEEEMTKRFGDEYYAQEDQAVASDDEEGAGEGKQRKKKHPKKPTWDDDIDIKDIIPDFEDNEDQGAKITLGDTEEDQAEDAEEDEEDEDSRPSKKRKTADHKRQRQESQKKARQERTKLEALVDSKLELSNHHLLSKPSHAPFRYRETSPQAFGMTARDILLAPSDQHLNEFAGLKKLATYRDEEKKRRDRKKLGKKARLRQWRRDVFGAEFERTGPTYGFERVVDEEDVAMGGVIETTEKGKKGEGQSNVVGDVGEGKKKRKRSKGKKHAAPTAVETED